jgi:hypothetical protein
MLFGIAFCTSASGLLSSETIFWGEQCTTGVLLAPTEGEGSGRVVADIAKLSVGREAYYTRELATDDEQYLSGHGESPARWYGACRYQPWAGGRASPAASGRCSRAAAPTAANLLAARMAATPSPPSRGVAADQGRLDPVRPGRPGHRPCGAPGASSTIYQTIERM